MDEPTAGDLRRRRLWRLGLSAAALLALGLSLLAVGLGHRVGHYPAQLSGGEQQRVAVARAFVGRPKLLLADEPTGNLDGTTGKQVMDLLFELARADRTTLILITHDMALAARCDRILRIADGLLVGDERLSAALAAQ